MLKTAVSLEIRIATQQSQKALLLIFLFAIPLRSSRLCVKSQYVPDSQSNLTTPAEWGCNTDLCSVFGIELGALPV